MIETTKKLKDKFDELTELISKPEIIADNKHWKTLVKERSSIEEIAESHIILKKLLDEKTGIEKTILTEKDPEMKKFFADELYETNKKIDDLEESIKILLLPKDENDDSNVIIEIRAAAGGEESALFGNLLMNMYRRYAERQGWQTEIIDFNETELGGVKEATFMIRGKLNGYIMTLKLPMAEGLLEKSQNLTRDQFSDFQNLGVFPEGDISKFIEGLYIELNDLEIIASLSTLRIEVEYEDLTLAIDENRYGDFQDYELEMEATSMKKAKLLLEKVCDEVKIPYKENFDSKQKRAITALFAKKDS